MRRLSAVVGFTGFVPLAAFLAAHVFWFRTALVSDATMSRVLRRVLGFPGAPWIELLAIGVPLGLHAALGLYATARRIPWREGLSSDLRAVLRVTGLVLFAFLVFHLADFRWARAFGGLRFGELPTEVAMRLSSTTAGVPVRAIVYLVGLGAALVHLVAGVWGMSTSKVLRGLATAASLVLFVGGCEGVVYLATGFRVLGGPAVLEIDRAPCPPLISPLSSSGSPGPDGGPVPVFPTQSP